MMRIRKSGRKTLPAPWLKRKPTRAYFFLVGGGDEGFLIVSTVVVVGRFCASFTGMNSPDFASRPILTGLLGDLLMGELLEFRLRDRKSRAREIWACRCGCVNFRFYSSGQIECLRCSTLVLELFAIYSDSLRLCLSPAKPMPCAVESGADKGDAKCYYCFFAANLKCAYLLELLLAAFVGVNRLRLCAPF
jgi:hypothetical protein